MKPRHAAALALYYAIYMVAFLTEHFRVVAVMGMLWGCILIAGAYCRWSFLIQASNEDRWYIWLLRRLTFSPLEDQIGTRWVIRLTYFAGMLIIICEMAALRSFTLS